MGIEWLWIWPLIGIIIGWAIASERGMAPAMGALGGALLGPFAILLIAVTPTEKKCPKCAENVKKEAVVCKHCGHDFNAGAAPAK